MHHCTEPVKWSESVQYAHKSLGIDTVIELGLGKTLSSLCKQIEPKTQTMQVIPMFLDVSNHLCSSLGSYDDLQTFLKEM